MDINNLTVQTKYEIISDQLGIMTVAYFVKGFDEWRLCGIVSGESNDLLHKLVNLKKGE